jgi:hypothetical protein
MADTSNSTVTFRLMSMPPPSRGAFQLTPQSMRLRVAVALEADPVVAGRVGGGAGVLEVDGYRLGDVLDSEIASDPVSRGAGLLDGGRDEEDFRVGVDVEEGVAAQVGVAFGVAGIDAGGPDSEG